METVWIIGVGRFGAKAAKWLSKHRKEWRFVLVDSVKKNLLAVRGPNIVLEQCDGIGFLTDRLEAESSVSWIVPSLPVHLAWEWCRMKMGPERLAGERLSPEIDSLLPNPMRGNTGDIYVSNADFICPPKCREPDLCTVTKQPRKKDMFRLLETIQYKDYTPIVLRSRQLGPGIGGYRPAQLFSFLEKVATRKGPILLCTACRCHGVITGAQRI